MLFRPLHPWHIFGLRVPMTPGVIPAKRHQLAENMGEVVGDHLLTSKEIALFVHGVSTSPFIREMREQLETDIALSEEVVKPFKLSLLGKVKAVVGKYVW